MTFARSRSGFGCPSKFKSKNKPSVPSPTYQNKKEQ